MPSCFPDMHQVANSHAHQQWWDFVLTPCLARLRFLQWDGTSLWLCWFLMKMLFLPPISCIVPLPLTIRDFHCILSHTEPPDRILECHHLSPVPHLLRHISFHISILRSIDTLRLRIKKNGPIGGTLDTNSSPRDNGSDALSSPFVQVAAKLPSRTGGRPGSPVEQGLLAL